METIEQKIIRLAPLIETFRIIHRSGSLTAAAEKLQLGKPVISKRLKQLETELNVTLIERTTRRLHLTSVGYKLLKHAENLHHEYSVTFENIDNWLTEPRGQLRITTADILSLDAVRITKKYWECYPNVVSTLNTDDHKIDLTANRYDIGLRYGWTDNENLVAKCFVEKDLQVIVIRTDQLDKSVDTPEAVSNLPWVVPDINVVDFRKWKLIHTKGRTAQLSYEPTYICHHSYQVKEMLYEGAGVVIWPYQQIRNDINSGLLTQLIPEWRLPSQQIYAMYPSVSSLSRNARLWLDVAEGYFQELKFPRN